MTVQNAAAALLIILPLAFDLFFSPRATPRLPEHPAQPNRRGLEPFKAGEVGLKLLWYGFMLTAVLLAPLAVLPDRCSAAKAWPLFPRRP